ncbi:hypothetical protein POPTR_017G106851v4 [Populus trichocarpa]|uniref:Uncharacterized protein n=1 Tax=Populus trichocarpa TaxID=3694 RepID=A0ACC0RRE4_POPTR|nr:hypothetical protein POPTR_017G106851v4 [Populus trichocarpa]
MRDGRFGWLHERSWRSMVEAAATTTTIVTETTATSINDSHQRQQHRRQQERKTNNFQVSNLQADFNKCPTNIEHRQATSQVHKRVSIA